MSEVFRPKLWADAIKREYLRPWPEWAKPYELAHAERMERKEHDMALDTAAITTDIEASADCGVGAGVAMSRMLSYLAAANIDKPDDLPARLAEAWDAIPTFVTSVATLIPAG